MSNVKMQNVFYGGCVRIRIGLGHRIYSFCALQILYSRWKVPIKNMKTQHVCLGVCPIP